MEGRQSNEYQEGGNCPQAETWDRDWHVPTHVPPLTTPWGGNSTLCMLSHFSPVELFVTPRTVAHQAPLSMGFCRQEYWSGLSCPLPGYLPDSGIEPMSPVAPALQADFCTTEPPGTPTTVPQRDIISCGHLFCGLRLPISQVPLVHAPHNSNQTTYL